MSATQAAKLDRLRQEVFALDEDGLWELVCLLLPDAAEETLEDIYDALLSSSRQVGQRISAEQVFQEEDERRGTTR